MRWYYIYIYQLQKDFTFYKRMPMIVTIGKIRRFLCGKGPSWGTLGPWGPNPMAYTVFHAGRITFFQLNRFENQNEPKRPQSGGLLGSFWFSTRPSADTGTDYKALGLWDNLRSSSSICPIIEVLIIISARVCQRPSWKPKRPQTATTSVAVWVRFGFQLDSLEKKWSA